MLKNGKKALTGYARTGKNRTVVVIPAMEDGVYDCTIPPLAGEAETISVTDLTTNQVIFDGKAGDFRKLRVPLRKERMGLYYIEVLPE